MGLNFNGTEIEKVVFNGVEVEVINFNGVKVWEKAGKYILSVKGGPTYDLATGGEFRFEVTTGSKGGTVELNNEITTVPPDTIQTITTTLPAGAYTLTLTGDFIEFGILVEALSGGGSNATYGTLVSIVDWRGLKYLPESFLEDGRYAVPIEAYRTIDIPAVIEELKSLSLENDNFNYNFINPYNIKKIAPTAFTASNGFTIPKGEKPYLNALIDTTGTYYILGDILIGWVTDPASTLTSVVVPDGTRLMIDGASGGSVTDGVLYTGIESLTNFTFNNDGALQVISTACLAGCTGLTELIIPASVKEIREVAFGNAIGEMNLTKVTFNHSPDSVISLPTPGSNGMFKVKTARNMDIYTDNKIIALYDYSADNITPTIYKLDGTLWDKVTTPTLSITGNILNISDSNATSFEITKSDSLTPITKTIVTNSVNLVELFEITDFTTELTISVVGLKEDIVKSDEVSITYTPVEE